MFAWGGQKDLKSFIFMIVVVILVYTLVRMRVYITACKLLIRLKKEKTLGFTLEFRQEI